MKQAIIIVLVTLIAACIAADALPASKTDFANAIKSAIAKIKRIQMKNKAEADMINTAKFIDALKKWWSDKQKTAETQSDFLFKKSKKKKPVVTSPKQQENAQQQPQQQATQAAQQPAEEPETESDDVISSMVKSIVSKLGTKYPTNSIVSKAVDAVIIQMLKDKKNSASSDFFIGKLIYDKIKKRQQRNKEKKQLVEAYLKMQQEKQAQKQQAAAAPEDTESDDVVSSMVKTIVSKLSTLYPTNGALSRAIEAVIVQMLKDKKNSA